MHNGVMVMESRGETGRWGEDLALDFLISRGFRLLARNWRWRRGEIDLVMRTSDSLVFVEVRTRGAGGYVSPFQSIRPAKWRVLRRTALAYRRRLRFPPRTLRFDVVGIEYESINLYEIFHYENVGVFGKYH